MAKTGRDAIGKFAFCEHGGGEDGVSWRKTGADDEGRGESDASKNGPGEECGDEP